MPIPLSLKLLRKELRLPEGDNPGTNPEKQLTTEGRLEIVRS